MKYTDEDFERFLKAFSNNEVALIHTAVRLVASNGLNSELCEDISSYEKKSLIRKVLRYVAKTALTGTFEIDGLSRSCNFCEMENGDPVSFGKDNEWTFWSHRLNQQVKVKIDFKHRYVKCFYSLSNGCLNYYGFDAWNGLHLTTDTGRMDIVMHFDDPRTDIK